MKTIKALKIVRVIIYSLIVLFLICSVALFILLKCCNLSYYIILSGSMKPDIQVDDLVVAQNLNETEVYDTLNAGDIATYFDTERDNYITHRIYEKSRDKDTGEGLFIFKGDNNNTIDKNAVKTNQIRSKYLFVIPNGSYIFDFINSYYGLIFLAAILLTLFMLDSTIVYAINLKIQKMNEQETVKNLDSLKDDLIATE
jgi:signal peptidase I